MRKRLKFIIPIVIIIALIGFFSTRTNSDTAKKLESTKVKKGNLVEKITISGQVLADEAVSLHFQTSGRLSWVGVKEGDYVKQYQSIASLDQRELKKSLQKDLNTYQKERLDFDQSKKEDKPLGEDSVVRDSIQTILDKNQLDLNSSVIDVELENLAIEYSNLWTPIEGIVSKVTSPFAGVNVTPSQAEFDIVNPTSVYFQASPDQTEVNQFFEGQTGELVLDAFPDETLSGNITHIAFIPQEGESNTVYPMKFSFTGDNSSYKYKIGMTGDLSFVTKREYDVLYIPNKYVQSEKGKKYVNIMEKNKLVKRDIETGLETDDYTEIKKGLLQGEIVYDQSK